MISVFKAAISLISQHKNNENGINPKFVTSLPQRQNHLISVLDRAAFGITLLIFGDKHVFPFDILLLLFNI